MVVMQAGVNCLIYEYAQFLRSNSLIYIASENKHIRYTRVLVLQEMYFTYATVTINWCGTFKTVPFRLLLIYYIVCKGN